MLADNATDKECFDLIQANRGETQYHSVETSNRIYAGIKMSLVITTLTALMTTTIAHSLWMDREAVRLNRAIDKALLLGERLGVSRNIEGYLHSDKELLHRIEKIVSSSAFSWDKTFKAPGIQCQTIGELADSGTNRFTELLKERRDGPLALTLNK
tara:strand:- start:5989 stop:6456 length:468 start_codon:yes stop_codon:yes gene_type:complete